MRDAEGRRRSETSDLKVPVTMSQYHNCDGHLDSAWASQCHSATMPQCHNVTMVAIGGGIETERDGAGDRTT